MCACADSRRDFWTTNWKSTVDCIDYVTGMGNAHTSLRTLPVALDLDMRKPTSCTAGSFFFGSCTYSVYLYAIRARMSSEASEGAMKIAGSSVLCTVLSSCNPSTAVTPQSSIAAPAATSSLAAISSKQTVCTEDKFASSKGNYCSFK